MSTLSRLLAIVAKPAVAIGGALVIGAGLIGYTYYATSVAPSGATARVSAGPLTQEVDVSGVVQGAQSTDLAFETSGRIASIRVAVGDQVVVGQTLLALESASQAAALAGAKASLSSATASLSSLLAGTRPESIAVDQAAVTAAENALAAAIRAAYVAADDAVENRADLLFAYPRSSPELIYANYADLKNTLEAERRTLITLLPAWQASLASLTPDTAASLASTTAANLAFIGTFLDNANLALSQSLPGQASAATLTTLETSIATGRTNVASAATTLAADQSTLTSANSSLTLAQAGPTEADVAGGRAGVDAAGAAVQAAQAALAETILTAPMSGTVTAQSANLGETVTPGVPLVSLIANGGYEVDARVSDTQAAQIHVGEPVLATLDAYPGATFTATVTRVDPAATVSSGASSYGVVVTFDSDPRLSAGLSATLRITTATADSALQVPSSAIITDASGAFVYVKGPHGAVKTPVTTGLVGASGMTQVLSGLSAGETVFAYGASAPTPLP